MRTFGASHAGSDGGEVEFDDGGEVEGIFFGGKPKKILGLVVVLNELDKFRGASRATKVSESFFVDGKVSHGGAIFGGHVGDGGAIGKGELHGAWAVKLDKFTNDFVLAKDLGHGKGEIGRGSGGGEFPREIDADHFRGQEGEGLSEHTRFRFDSADAPTDDAEAVDHGGVRVGADERVRIGKERSILLFLGEDAAGEVLEIDLMDDADAGRNHAEGGKGLLPPLEEFVTFPITFELMLHVEHEGLRGAVDVDLDGVVDDEVDGDKRFDQFGIFF